METQILTKEEILNSDFSTKETRQWAVNILENLFIAELKKTKY